MHKDLRPLSRKGKGRRRPQTPAGARPRRETATLCGLPRQRACQHAARPFEPPRPPPRRNFTHAPAEKPAHVTDARARRHRQRLLEISNLKFQILKPRAKLRPRTCPIYTCRTCFVGG